jgi:hypothetical protein
MHVRGLAIISVIQRTGRCQPCYRDHRVDVHVDGDRRQGLDVDLQRQQ